MKNNRKIVASAAVCIKAVCAVFALTALALLASCTDLLVSEECNPRFTWEKFAGCISDGDYSAAFELTGGAVSSSDISALTVSNSDGKLDSAFLKSFSRCFSYEYVSETDVEGVTAWQTVKVTSFDVRKLVDAAVENSVKDAGENAYINGSYKTDEEVYAAICATVTNLLPKVEKDCLTVAEIRVKFRYRNGDWAIVMNDELYDAVSGYSRHIDEAMATYTQSHQITSDSDNDTSSQ